MSIGTQVCAVCGKLEHGMTGSANRYVCTGCWRDGWRPDGMGNVYRKPSADPQPLAGPVTFTPKREG